jgi:hypothetical protein
LPTPDLLAGSKFFPFRKLLVIVLEFADFFAKYSAHPPQNLIERRMDNHSGSFKIACRLIEKGV